MEQRGKDLQGYAGQIRGFDLDQFLSDWEDPGMPVPWTVGDHALPSPVEKSAIAPAGAALATAAGLAGPASSASAIYDSVFTALGCKHVVKVLFLPDYVATGPRLSEGAAICRGELRMCVGVRPFVEDFGHAAFFDKSKKYVENQIILDKRDLPTSVAAVLRSIATHQPDVAVGSGQGGAVPIALASPTLLEVCLAARNFQLPEKHIVVIQPQLARKDKIGPMFKLIAPELYDEELKKSSPSPEG